MKTLYCLTATLSGFSRSMDWKSRSRGETYSSSSSLTSAYSSTRITIEKYINRESKDAIRSAVNELERAGYIERHQTTDEGGKFSSNEYIIHEQPVSLPPSLDKPSSENPTTGKPTSENPTQLNKDRVTKDQAITDRSITHSFPSLSHPPAETAGAGASPPERKGTEAATQSGVEIFRDIIKKNIEYDHLMRYSQIDSEELDGIVELLVETVCTARRTIRVAGDDYPAELVKAKLLKLNSSHIEFVMDCMRQNTTKIRNIKKYLLAVLFNAPNTIGSYYTALVAHDMAEG